MTSGHGESISNKNDETPTAPPQMQPPVPKAGTMVDQLWETVTHPQHPIEKTAEQVKLEFHHCTDRSAPCPFCPPEAPVILPRNKGVQRAHLKMFHPERFYRKNKPTDKEFLFMVLGDKAEGWRCCILCPTRDTQRIYRTRDTLRYHMAQVHLEELFALDKIITDNACEDKEIRNVKESARALRGKTHPTLPESSPPTKKPRTSTDSSTSVPPTIPSQSLSSVHATPNALRARRSAPPSFDRQVAPSTATRATPSSSRTTKCRLCDKRHPTNTCDRYASVADRERRLRKLGRCLNCLDKSCKKRCKPSKCSICGKCHDHVLCPSSATSTLNK